MARWVAGTVRAAALARRRLDPARLRRLAAEGSLPAAVARLAGTPYARDLSGTQTLAEAQHAVAANLLWHLRVLGGWLPPDGARTLRALAAGFEVANVDELLAGLQGRPREPAYRLGTLETAWSRLAQARTPEQLRQSLGTSPWGDPGAATAAAVHLGMTLAWAERVVESVPAAADWARATAALTVTRETLLGRAPVPGSAAARLRRLLGATLAESVTSPTSLPDLVTRLPRHLARLWGEGLAEAEDLWRAESALIDRVELDGHALVRRGGYGPDHVVGAVAVLAVDAWRTRAALALAAHGAPASADHSLRTSLGDSDALV